MQKQGNIEQGGGVALYVKQSYHHNDRNDIAINVNDIIESAFIELSVKPKNIIIGIIYRPPNDKFEQFEKNLMEILKKLNYKTKRAILWVTLISIC